MIRDDIARIIATMLQFDARLSEVADNGAVLDAASDCAQEILDAFPGLVVETPPSPDQIAQTQLLIGTLDDAANMLDSEEPYDPTEVIASLRAWSRGFASGAVETPTPPPAPGIAQPFVLHRTEDVSGTSGIGVVAWGVEFPDGACALRWNTQPTSTALYASLSDVEAIHGHEGRTKVIRAVWALGAAGSSEDRKETHE